VCPFCFALADPVSEGSCKDVQLTQKLLQDAQEQYLVSLSYLMSVVYLVGLREDSPFEAGHRSVIGVGLISLN
jgi:hypothetical protein